MKTFGDILFRWPLMVLLLVLAFALPALADETLKAEALLIWGTNDEALPSDTKLTPVDASLAGKLVKSGSEQPRQQPHGGQTIREREAGLHAERAVGGQMSFDHRWRFRE